MVSTLTSLGHEVLGIDSDEEVVQGLAAEFPRPTWSPRTWWPPT
jgi:Trk K+ transport system NAD-binding subunit